MIDLIKMMVNEENDNNEDSMGKFIRKSSLAGAVRKGKANSGAVNVKDVSFDEINSKCMDLPEVDTKSIEAELK